MELAHPLTEPGGLPLPPAVVATLALCVVAAAWRVPVPLGPVDQAVERARSVRADEDRLPPAMLATRALGVALLALAIAAGRFGDDSELRNIAPVLVVGAGWPLLVLASAVLGDVWRWLDPFDSLARLIAPAGAPDPEPDVRWAALPALVWAGYLSLPLAPLAPRSVGALVAVYTIATLAGCLAVGRRRWLGRVEFVGITAGLVARLPRGRRSRELLPRGADLLLGTLAGGLVFDVLRISDLWGSLGSSSLRTLWSVLGLLGCAALAVGVVRVLEVRGTRLQAPGTATAALVPVTVAVVLAVAMARNRLTTSVQLLAARISDPFGQGWDLFGTAELGLVPSPFGGTEGLVIAQVVVLVAGAVAAVVVARRRSRDPRRQGPAVGVAAVVCGAAILAVTAV